MTDLYEGQVTDLILNNSRYNPEIQAISYALQMEKQRIMGLAQRTRTMAMIDELPEPILDVLAVELRTPYYTGDMTVDQKRTIVKNTLVWFNKAGTPAAVQELVAATFGQGEVVEWFNFTEEPFTPGTFDIVTDARMSDDIVLQFSRIIKFVKNTRSHIRRVLVEKHGKMAEYAGAYSSSSPTAPISNHKKTSASASLQDRIGAGASSAPKTAIFNFSKKAIKGGCSVISKAGAASAPTTNILNCSAPRTEKPNSYIHFTIGGMAELETTIGNHVPKRHRTATSGVNIGIALVVRNSHIAILNCPPPRTNRITQPQVANVAMTSNSNITIGR